MLAALGTAVAILALVTLTAAPRALAGEARIEVADGLVSARFDAVPVAEAIAAIHRAAGLEVVLPASVRDRTVSVTADRLPLEGFIRRLLEVLDVGGYALVYDADGQRRLIVVESGRGTPSPGAAAGVGAAARGGDPPPAPAVVPAGAPASPFPGRPPVHAMPLVSVETTGIAITPRGEYQRLDLTVSAGDGAQIRRQYPSGTQAYFDIVDEQGKPLRDGSYAWRPRSSSSPS